MATRRRAWSLARFLHRKQLPGEKEKNALAANPHPSFRRPARRAPCVLSAKHSFPSRPHQEPTVHKSVPKPTAPASFKTTRGFPSYSQAVQPVGRGAGRPAYKAGLRGKKTRVVGGPSRPAETPARTTQVRWHIYEETWDGSAPGCGLWHAFCTASNCQARGKRMPWLAANSDPSFRSSICRALSLGKAFFSFSPTSETHGAQKRAKAHSPRPFHAHARVSFMVSGFPACGASLSNRMVAQAFQPVLERARQCRAPYKRRDGDEPVVPPPPTRWWHRLSSLWCLLAQPDGGTGFPACGASLSNRMVAQAFQPVLERARQCRAPTTPGTRGRDAPPTGALPERRGPRRRKA